MCVYYDNSDLEKVSSGTGEKLSFVFQALGVFVAGLVVGFVYVWQVALLIIGCAPMIILAGAAIQWVSVDLLHISKFRIQQKTVNVFEFLIENIVGLLSFHRM